MELNIYLKFIILNSDKYFINKSIRANILINKNIFKCLSIMIIII